MSLVRSCFLKSSLCQVKSVSSQVCLVWMLGYHVVNKLHLGSSLRSPSVDSITRLDFHACELQLYDPELANEIVWIPVRKQVIIKMWPSKVWGAMLARSTRSSGE